MRAANDNIKWSGRGRRPKTPDFILWQEGGVWAPWGERNLYMQEDCRFGGEEKYLSTDGAMLVFLTSRYDDNGRLRNGPLIFGVALPDVINTNWDSVEDWSSRWFWSREDALNRLDRRLAYFAKRIEARDEMLRKMEKAA